MLETIRHVPPVVHFTALILPIKQRETPIAKRLYHRTYHPLKRTARNNILPLLVLHKLCGLLRIGRDVTRVGDEDRRFRDHIHFHVTGIQSLPFLPYQLMMPDRFTPLWRTIPVDTRKIIGIHTSYSAGCRPWKRNKPTRPVSLSIYSHTVNCTRRAPFRAG